MEPLYFVMAIMGCGDAGAACEQARVEPVRYRTALECQAAMPGVLARNSDLSFPEITGACQQQGLRMAKTGGRSRG
ncbi:hypothetical protein [Sphingomonas yantingensis]|jgi:hypothetical protein|uniref:Uncharacterized protein n=1 Tax=Sphingomonas yantingensis TaxID=1241761 RepID=A0A7W9APP5_9SPHN|nr:hypothetical protein [Sphingomonas yantingensis]MBB5698245.1 hypothetical protein [Sphingomonas yantingensis]